MINMSPKNTANGMCHDVKHALCECLCMHISRQKLFIKNVVGLLNTDIVHHLYTLNKL